MLSSPCSTFLPKWKRPNAFSNFLSHISAVLGFVPIIPYSLLCIIPHLVLGLSNWYLFNIFMTYILTGIWYLLCVKLKFKRLYVLSDMHLYDVWILHNIMILDFVPSVICSCLIFIFSPYLPPVSFLCIFHFFHL